MRHQAGHVALFIADAGDVLQRAVGICGVGQVAVGVAVLPQDLIVSLELRERFFVGKIAAFTVGDWHAKNFSRRNLAGERRIVRGGLEENVFAVELQVAIADERAGQQARFGENLKAVADAENEAAVVGELFHGLHHGAEPCNRAAAQVIAVAETAGHDDAIGVAERGVLVPDEARGMAEQADGVDGVLVAVRGGELEDGKIHFIWNNKGAKTQSENWNLFLRALASLLLFGNFQFVIFDDRIAEELVRGIVDGLLRGGLVRARCEVDLDILADVDAGDAGVAHVFEGGLDGFALRIQDGFLWGDDDFCFHARAGKFCGKKAPEASQKVCRLDSPSAKGECFSSASADCFMRNPRLQEMRS